MPFFFGRVNLVENLEAVIWRKELKKQTKQKKRYKLSPFGPSSKKKRRRAGSLLSEKLKLGLLELGEEEGLWFLNFLQELKTLPL